MLMLTGTYTRNTGSEGVYGFEVDDECRKFEPTATNRQIDNPSWLVHHPALDVVYAVNEVRDRDGGGGITAFGHNSLGVLSELGEVSSMGGDPCHLAIDSAGRYLLVSNYGGGNLASFALGKGGEPAFAGLVQHAGRGVDPMRQKGPHVHSITLDNAGNAYVADLGLDQVVRYPVGAGGSVSVEGRRTLRLRPGAGPRMLAFDRACRYGYVVNELDNTLVVVERDDKGDLIELGTYSALPGNFADASYCAHIAITRDDRFVYASNRGHDSMVVFRVEPDGKLSLVQHESTKGRHPRHFAMTPDERYLLVANRDDNNIVVFERNADTGELAFTGTELTVPAPVCILFCP
ncbi:MAG TPA: lactonase family protein [Pseudomonadales bacterium]|nr:lactonase family protein [Pseudomonadales bacterium]